MGSDMLAAYQPQQNIDAQTAPQPPPPPPPRPQGTENHGPKHNTTSHSSSRGARNQNQITWVVNPEEGNAKQAGQGTNG